MVIGFLTFFYADFWLNKVSKERFSVICFKRIAMLLRDLKDPLAFRTYYIIKYVHLLVLC